MQHISNYTLHYHSTSVFRTLRCYKSHYTKRMRENPSCETKGSAEVWIMAPESQRMKLWDGFKALLIMKQQWSNGYHGKDSVKRKQLTTCNIMTSKEVIFNLCIAFPLVEHNHQLGRTCSIEETKLH